MDQTHELARMFYFTERPSEEPLPWIERAVERADQLVQRFPGRLRFSKQVLLAHKLMACTLAASGDEARAEWEFQKALAAGRLLLASPTGEQEYGPQFGDLLRCLADFETSRGRILEAENYYLESVRICEGRHKVWRSDFYVLNDLLMGSRKLGDLYMVLNRMEDGRRHYQRFVDIYTNHGSRFADSHWLYHYIDLRTTCFHPRFRDLDEASRLLEIALRKHPQDRNLLALRAIVHYQSGNWDQAVTSLKACLDHTPSSILLHYYLVRAYCRLGQVEQAVSAYWKGTAVRLRPSDFEAAFLLHHRETQLLLRLALPWSYLQVH